MKAAKLDNFLFNNIVLYVDLKCHLMQYYSYVTFTYFFDLVYKFILQKRAF